MEPGRASAAALWVVLIPTPLGAQAVTAEPAARCEFSVPMLPAPPADSVLDGYAEPHSVYEWDGGYERAHLGIGRLAVVERTHYPWYAGVIVPLYDKPNGALVASINRGFTEGPAGERRAPLTGAGVVETSYEEKTPVVYDRTPSGWLRIRLWSPSRGSSDPADGTFHPGDFRSLGPGAGARARLVVRRARRGALPGHGSGGMGALVGRRPRAMGVVPHARLLSTRSLLSRTFRPSRRSRRQVRRIVASPQGG